MSLLRDYKDHHLTLAKKYWWRQIINPVNLYRTMQHRHQRAERGWSDRDAWNAGDHILSVTSGMLKDLAESQERFDWAEYFETNYKTNGYASLAEVAADIDEYIAFDDYNWVDTLGFKLKHSWKDSKNGGLEMVDENTPEEQRLIKKAIKESHREWKRRYTKMQKAMKFVADNIGSLWE